MVVCFPENLTGGENENDDGLGGDTLPMWMVASGPGIRGVQGEWDFGRTWRQVLLQLHAGPFPGRRWLGTALNSPGPSGYDEDER